MVAEQAPAVQPPSFRSVLLQERVPLSVSPMASRMSSLSVGNRPRSGSNTLVQASGATPVNVGGLDALQRIVDGSVSTVQVASPVPVGEIPAQGVPLSEEVPCSQMISIGLDIPPVQGDSGILPASLPDTSVHPPPQEGGLHHITVQHPGDSLPAQVMVSGRGTCLMSGRSSEDCNPGGDIGGEAQVGTHSSGQDDTFISAQEMLSTQTILYDPAWRTQQWEHHRLQRCARFGFSPGPIIPLAERLENMPPDTRVLPYGIRRTSIGTWVTTMEGQSAFYPRRAREYEEWDLDEDRNQRPPFPRHPSFDDTVDEDDFFIDYVSCTSNFSFTAHPEDYEGCTFIPPTSISIRRHATTLEDDVHVAWPSDDGDSGGVLPFTVEHLGLQRATVLSMARTLDDVLEHILVIFARNRDLGARIVGARDEAESSVLQLSEYVTTTISSFRDAVMVDIGDLRQSFDAEIDEVSDDFHNCVAALEERMDRLERRMDLLPSTSPVPPLQAIRGSLTALERAATKRLTDHANSLLVSLSRRRGPRAADRRDGGRSSGASGWSVASDSQLSVDAPADHGGDNAPVPLRGGGTTPRLEELVSPLGGIRMPSQPLGGSPLQQAVSDPNGIISTPGECTQQAGVQGLASVTAPSFAPLTGGCQPTPWITGNIFSARDNAANASRVGVSIQPVGHGVHNRPPDVATSPDEVVVHGQRYLRAPMGMDSSTVLAPPPGMDLRSPLLLASAQRVSTLAKCWHGGGQSSAFLSGVEYISTDQVVDLGVPSSMAFVVVAAHHQIYPQWCRALDRGAGQSDRGFNHDRNSRPHDIPGRSFGPNEAIKYSGWPELPRDGVTPERWIEFYTALQLMGNYFNIGIMPFDALDLTYSDGGHALCICGLGYSIFTKMGTSLFLIVQKLLPLSVPEISTKVQSVALNGGNGFELLWVLTKHFVPMVSTTKHLGWPQWPSSDDPFCSLDGCLSFAPSVVCVV